MNKSFQGAFNMMSSIQQGGTNKMSQFTTGHLQVKRILGGVVFTEPQKEGSLMYRMTSWMRSKDPFNSEGGMEEKVEGGPPEEKNQKREELKKKENVQKTFEERIGFLQKQLEAAFAEISLRKEEQSKFLEENEELRAENQHLSNIIGSLQIDKQIDMENLTTKIDDLERTNEHLKKEFCNQEVILEQYKNELMEKQKENIKIKEKLDKVRQNKRKLEIFAEKKMEVIKQISEQTQELEESLNEDELLAANEIIPSLKEELEEGDKTKEENRHRMTKLRLNRTSLKMDKDDQKDVQKDDRDNKSEEKVVEAQDQDTNGRKAEKEEVGGASGVGQLGNYHQVLLSLQFIQHILIMAKLLKPSRLDTDPSSSNAAKEWKHWHRTFTNFIEESGDAAPDKLRELENCVSSSVYELIEDCSIFESAIAKLDSVYVKLPNEIFARHVLATRRQQS
ncbi:golgin subfamily A member 6-like protein 22 [Palaemon carinicauda]|uniref:golgin subfamily A member 6-like protein 22 n=1 Tax=Palaemon carinicauda TaxID=392227 RepID=UPI0035B67D76